MTCLKVISLGFGVLFFFWFFGFFWVSFFGFLVFFFKEVTSPLFSGCMQLCPALIKVLMDGYLKTMIQGYKIE